MMAINKRKPKKVLPRRAKTGIGAIPTNKGYEYTKNYFHYEVDNKDLVSVFKAYLKANHTKAELKSILANPEYKFYSHTHYATIAWWLTMELPKDDKVEYWETALKRYVIKLADEGKILLKEKAEQPKETNKVVALTPAQRTANKIGNTIMQDLLDLEDDWIAGEKTTIDVYQLFQKHGLSGTATKPVREVLDGWLLDYEDAYHKRCDQAVEGYNHLKRPEIKRRITAINDMLADLDKIKNAAKALRATRLPKPKSADKQVSKVQYKKEDKDLKLVSIPPIQLIGRSKMYTYDTKEKLLKEFVSTSTTGFSISGSTLKDFNAEESRQIRLRKPDEILPVVQNKSSRQIDKAWTTLTTKTSVPNGRINANTIILRIMD